MKKFYRMTLAGTFLVLCGCESGERKVTPEMLHFPESASGTASDTDDLPRIAFELSEFNFDTIAIGEKVMYSFRFTNDGGSPLVIDRVHPSCGCTTLKDWPQQPIQPGEGGSITVEFNSTGFTGPIEKTVQVSTNGVPRDWYLRLKGFVAGQEGRKEQDNPVQMERVR